MRDTKLSVALLDNAIKSAVVNIGKTGAYIEVWVNGTDISICLINDEGDIVRSIDAPLTTLKGENK
jgi:hypothetical protein